MLSTWLSGGLYFLALSCALLCTDSKLTRPSTTIDGPPPDLSLDYRLSYFLATGEVWLPGMNTLVTLLMAHQPLTMQIQLTDGASEKLGPASFYLLYKCSPDDRNFGEVNLKSNASETTAATPAGDKDTAVFCKQHQPFVITLSPVAERSYNLTLLSANGSIAFENSTQHYLEFRLLVRFSIKNKLQSKSLFVFNWDSVPDLDTVKKSMTYNSLSVPYTRYILTKEAVQYIMEIAGPGKNELKSVPFLDQSFVKLVASSSLLVRAHLAVTVVLRFDGSKSCSDDFKSLNDIYISTGEPLLFNETSVSFATVYSSLDLVTGVLYVTDASFKGLRKKQSSLRCTVCLRISVNSEVWSYHTTRTVTTVQLVPSPGSPSSTTGTFVDGDCKVHSGKSSEAVILLTGMRNVVFRSPIVCKNPGTKQLSQQVYFNESSCLLPVDRGKHIDCVSYLSTKSGGVISLTGDLSIYHSKKFTFRTGNVDYHYNVTVVTLPLFITKNGRYESEAVSSMHAWLFNLTCMVSYSGLSQPVSMASFFRVTRNTRLFEMTADEFALTQLRTSPREISKTFTNAAQSSAMTVTVSYVQPALSDSKFIVICQASVAEVDTLSLLGVRTEYQSETHSIATYQSLAPLKSARISTACYWLICACIKVLLATASLSQ